MIKNFSSVTSKRSNIKTCSASLGIYLFIDLIIIIPFVFYGTDKCFLFLIYLSSSKDLKILNLGDGQRRTSGVAAVLDSTDDNSVDPHLERIKNQACNE